jgi:hypothetical protein
MLEPRHGGSLGSFGHGLVPFLASVVVCPQCFIHSTSTLDRGTPTLLRLSPSSPTGGPRLVLFERHQNTKVVPDLGSARMRELEGLMATIPPSHRLPYTCDIKMLHIGGSRGIIYLTMPYASVFESIQKNGHGKWYCAVT